MNWTAKSLAKVSKGKTKSHPTTSSSNGTCVPRWIRNAGTRRITAAGRPGFSKRKAFRLRMRQRPGEEGTA